MGIRDEAQSVSEDRKTSIAKGKRERVGEGESSLVKGDLAALGGDNASGSSSTGDVSDMSRFPINQNSPSGGTSSSSATSTASSSVTSETTSSTTSSSSVATESTSSTTSSAAESTSSATSAAAESTGASVVRLGSGVVDSDRSASELLALESLESGLGHVLVGELNVTVTLGGTGLSVSGQSDGLDVSVVTEGLVDLVLGERVAQTSNVESAGRLRELVTESLGSLLGGGGGLSGLRVVDSDGSAVNVGTVLLNGLGGTLERSEGDESETSGSARALVHHDLGADNLTAGLELGLEPVVVDVPRELTDKDGGGGLVLSVVLDLGLLGRSGLLVVGLSLAWESQHTEIWKTVLRLDPPIEGTSRTSREGWWKI